jgi:DNA-binding MarR family transcriptional regulator
MAASRHWQSFAFVAKRRSRGVAMDDQEKTGFEVATLVRLLKVATRIARPMRDGVGDPEQLSVTELRIVLALGGEGDLAGHELAELMAMQPMNVSRALMSLSKMGLARAADNEGNRRRKPYGLTTSGDEKYRNMLARMQVVSQFVFGGLDEAERSAIAILLAKLDERLIEWETPAELSHINRA